MSRTQVSEAKRKLREILRKSEKLGVTRDEVMKLSSTSKLRALAEKRLSPFSWVWQGSGWLLTIAAVGFLFLAALFVCYGGSSSTTADPFRQEQYQALCTIDMPRQLVRIFRPPEDCSMCRGLRRVEKVSNLSPTGFQEKYSDQGKPVVVIDATRNWTAQRVFNFRFLKTLYHDQMLERDCQLQAAESPASDLGVIFNESHPPISQNTRPWRVSWKSCGERTSAILRQHYSKPYFLPATTQDSKLAWIYLGSPGYRESMNVDTIDQPSWQAQIRGSQKWYLHPPPECYYQCESLEVTLNPGEMIVVDTTRWYHETAVVSDELSIAVGDYFKNT